MSPPRLLLTCSLCHREPLHLGVYLSFCIHFYLTIALQCSSLNPRMPGVALFLMYRLLCFWALWVASSPFWVRHPDQSHLGPPKELQQKPESRTKTLCCVCGRILTQPNENIPTGRGKIHQKAVGRRQHRDLSRSEPQPVLEKAVAPRWVLSSTEGGLATDIYGRGFSLPWLPTHLEALWKNPHLSHPFRHDEFTGI